MNPHDVIASVPLFTKALIDQARDCGDRNSAERLLRHHLHQLLLQSGAVTEAVGEQFCSADVSLKVFDDGREFKGRSAAASYWAQAGAEANSWLLFDQVRVAVAEWGVLTEQIDRIFRPRDQITEVSSTWLSTVYVFGPDNKIDEIRIYPARRSETESVDGDFRSQAEVLKPMFASLIAQTRAMLR